jgi:hypothetical protein
VHRIVLAEARVARVRIVEEVVVEGRERRAVDRAGLDAPTLALFDNSCRLSDTPRVPSRRADITMSADEQMAFLDGQLFGVLATIGPSGHPHQVTIGYARDGLDAIVMSSFAAAQKVVNVRRSPPASFLVEVPAPYSEIRGVLFAGEAAVVDDREEVARWYYRIKERGEALPIDTNLPSIDDEKLLAKRVLIVLTVEQAITWDHRKLGGVY